LWLLGYAPKGTILSDLVFIIVIMMQEIFLSKFPFMSLGGFCPLLTQTDTKVERDRVNCDRSA
jgi:hypothetical protein